MFNLRRINTVGHIWPTRRPVSRAEGLNLKRVEALGLPCWDEANTKSLYAAEKKEIYFMVKVLSETQTETNV